MSDLNDAFTRFGGYTIQDGQLVSDRVQRIIEAIRDYDPSLDVVWIPDRQARAEGIPQFKVIHHQDDGFDFILFHVKDEEEFDERVLLRIIQNDQRKNPVTLSEFEAWEQTKKLMERQLYLDALEEVTDIAAKVFASHKNTYKVNDEVTVKDGIPFNANRLRDPKFISHQRAVDLGKKEK